MFNKFNAIKVYINKVFKLGEISLKKLFGILALFLILSLFDILGLSLIYPYISILIGNKNLQITEIIIYKKIGVQNSLTIIILFIYLIKSIISISINKYIITYSWNQKTELRLSLVKRFLNIEYSKYIEKNSAEYMISIFKLTDYFAGHVIQPLLRLSCEIIVSFFIIAYLFYINPVALTILIILALTMVYIYDKLYRIKLRKLGEVSNKSEQKMISILNEMVDGLKEIRIMAIERYFYRIFKKNALINSRCTVKSEVIGTSPRYMLELLIISFVVGVTFISTIMDNSGIEIISSIGIFGVASMRLLPALNIIIHSMTQLRHSKDTVERLYSDYALVTTENNFKNKNLCKDSESFKELELKDVSFSFGYDKNIFNNLNLKIKAGKQIAIIGSSGVGKSTLIELLLGLRKITKGVIQINGRDLYSNLDWFRNKVAYLPQNVFLINNSLKNNIALGDSSFIDISKIEQVIEQSMLSNWVKELPSGYDQYIGDRGIKISGGQRQRVVLARAFYYSKELIILDESTSSLDEETEDDIIRQLNKLKGKTTIIYIAHRMSTIKYCDEVYELSSGVLNKINKS